MVENVDHYIEKFMMKMDVRLGFVLWWCLFLAKFEASGAYRAGAYKKKRVCVFAIEEVHSS